MIDKVLHTINKYSMLSGVRTVGVAVSGGADSVCLLHVLHRTARELGIRLHVLHLNHQLRGTESDLDAAFVADLAESLGWPVTIGGATVEAVPGNLEEAGRQARRAFFLKMIQQHGIDAVATAHTASDQAETVLYRLLRGSGTAGLSGILPVTNERIIRPLLQNTREEVLGFLNTENLAWREDRTNQDCKFARNRIRHTLLPLIRQQFSPEATEILAATAGVARDEELFWATHIEEITWRICKKTPGGVLVEAEEISRLPRAVARRVTRRAIQEVKGNMRSIDLLHVERILQLASRSDGHGRVQIPGLDIFRSFELMRITPQRKEPRTANDYDFPISLTEEESSQFDLPGCNCSILLEIDKAPAEDCNRAYNKDVDELDWGAISGQLELRNWHPGDELKVPGRSSQKLKTLFQESRIPIWDRQTWPVLTFGNDIVWTRRFGPSEHYLRTSATQQILRVHVLEKTANPS